MSALNAAALSSLAGWIEDKLSNECADRQTICEDTAAQLRDMAAALRQARENGSDARVSNAREYLNGARRRKLAQLPPSLLLREAAELRRLLGQVLDVLGELQDERVPDLSDHWKGAAADAGVPPKFCMTHDGYYWHCWDRCPVCAAEDAASGDVIEDQADGAEDDGTEPYCTTCGQWTGVFVGIDGWRHFRGDPAPGGVRELYDPGHEPVIGWTVPPGRALAPGGMAAVLDGLAVAAEYRRYRASLTCQACAQHPAELCEDHASDLDRADEYDQLADQIRKATL